MSDNHESPFLRLPPEIRLEIYELLILTPSHNPTPTPTAILSSHPDYHEYEHLKTASSSTTSTPHNPQPTLRIRAEDPQTYSSRRATHTRSTFLVRSDRFRARCMLTTYHLQSAHPLSTSLLQTNKQIHAECASLLYSHHTFDFDTHIEAIVPFLSDLTPLARASITSLRLVKRALPYEKDFDRAEWATACEYLGTEMPGLKKLDLGIVAGKPGVGGWEGVVPFSKMEIGWLCEMGGEGWEWVGDLLRIGGLEGLRVTAVVEHCPPPMSGGMARFVRFSASVDGGFGEFLRERMVCVDG